jgi:UDP-3-O-[3-hydroxymyristoyl] glucosamine N-acyltransferase
MKLPREMTLAQVAALVGGHPHGDPNFKILGFAESAFAAEKTDIALVFEPKLLKRLVDCTAGAVIIPKGNDPAPRARPTIIVERPMLAIRKILAALEPVRYFPPIGIHPTSVIDPSAQLETDVAIGPFVVIGAKCRIGARTKIMASTVIGGEVSIGEDCILFPSCLIADHVKIGNRVILKQGASLGSDGFGYVTEKPSNMEKRMVGDNNLSDEPNPPLKIPQTGIVIVEDDVEVGSYATIDRATIGATIIGKSSKIDNQVMIAHNNKIGREVIVVSHTGIAGSCNIGDRVILAGHVGVKDHITIGKDAIIEGMAGVMKDVNAAEVHVGVPNQPVKDHMFQLAHVRKLPKIYDELKSLQKRVLELEQKLLEYESKDHSTSKISSSHL